MKEIQHHKYSLFLLERGYGNIRDNLSEKCFEYLNTFDTLKEAQKEQKEYGRKTIILPSY